MMPMDAQLVRLSKIMAKALRHTPWLYELELDDEGWVLTEDLLATLREQRLEWQSLSETDFAAVIAQSDKRRYEMQGGRIRALYGHSTPHRLRKVPAIPPEILYHGTMKSALPAILKQGLQPMRRQYVHLSVETKTASLIARRKGDAVVILLVKAGDAHRDGVVFYEGNETVWLADTVPPKYLSHQTQ